MKWSNDADELGASKVGAIVMGETPFQTNEAVRQIVLNAKAGVKAIDDGLYKDARDRGNYLEPALTEWASDKLDDITVTGFGALEIKTDGWDDGPPRADQVIQLQTQMFCADFTWGVIAKLGPKLKFELYPYVRNEKLIDIIMEKVNDFWVRVDLDQPYPPIDNGKPDTIPLDHLETKDDVIQIITDYNKCKAEEKSWKLQKEKCQEALELVLDQVDAEYATIGNYKISHPIVKRKAQPEKIIPAKPSTEHRRFTVEEIN